MRKIATLCSLLLIVMGMAASNDDSMTLHITQAVKADATFDVLKTIQKAKENGGNATITFEKGEYHFYPEYAYERYQFYSNHGDYLSRFAFFLDDMENLTIDGNGSTFVLHGILAPFLVEDCEDIAIKNIAIDYAEAFHSEGVIVANNPEERTFDMRISDEYPYEIRNDQLIFLKSYYEHPIGQNYSLDKETKHIAYNPVSIPYMSPKGRKYDPKSSFNVNSFEYINEVDSFDFNVRNRGLRELITAKQLEPGLVRIKHATNKALPRVGMVMIMKGHQGFNRLFAGFKFENCKDVSVAHVDLHHAAGMGFLFENCENTDLFECTTLPSKGRYVSVTADATHYIGSRGTLSMRNCKFTNQLDDGTNIHGTYQYVDKVIDKHTLAIRVIHHQQLGFVLGREGDRIGVLDHKESFLPWTTLTLDKVERVNGRFHLLTFKETLPAGIKSGQLLENVSAYPEVLIENSRFSHNRARALLISTPLKTTIRNNYFNTEMAAIILGGAEFNSYWGESGRASNVVISNNVFEDCGVRSKVMAPIQLHSYYDGQFAIQNIVIKNNVFKQTENAILNVGNVDGLTFEGNTITNPATFPQKKQNDPAISITNSRNISFKGNHYQGKAKEIVRYLDKKTKQVKFK